MAESSSTGALPTTIRGLLSARLDALPAEERSLLLDAAVVGKTFWRGALAGGDGRDGVSELLGALERRDLIVRDTGSIIEGDQQFSFKHVLIRDVAYELLPRAERRERHARVAEYFEESTAEIGRPPPRSRGTGATRGRATGRSATSCGRPSRPSAAGPRTRRRSSTARRSTSSRTTTTGSRTFAAGSRSRARRPCTSRTPAC
jgi:hypothetical protein